MKNRWKILGTTVGMLVLLAVVVGSMTIYTLYRGALKTQSDLLTSMVQTQIHLISAVADFDSRNSQNDHPDGAVAATISQVLDGHQRMGGFGASGEFAFGVRNGDFVEFIDNHRFGDQDTPRRIPVNSRIGEPMIRALNEPPGVVIGPDYRNEPVLAAYGYVDALELGIVAKIDMAELQAPFMQAATRAGVVSLLVIFVGVLATFTTSGRMLKRLVRSEASISAVLDAAPNSVFTTTAAGQIRSFNPSAEAQFGFREADIVGQHFNSILDDATRQKIEEAIASKLGGRRFDLTRDLDVFCKTKDGSLFPAEITLSHTHGLQPGLYVFVVRDISDEMESERLLRDSQAKFAAAFYFNSIPMVLTELETGTVVDINRAGKDVLELTGGNIASQHNLRVTFWDTGEQRQEFVERLLADGEVVDSERTFRKCNGEMLTIRWSAALLHLAGVPYSLASFLDITDYKAVMNALGEHSAELENLNLELMDKNAEIQRMYHTLCHELKTPLTSTREFISLVLDGIPGPVNDDQCEYLSLAKEGCDELTVHMHDLVDITRMETGKFSCTLVPSDICELVNHVVAQFESKAKKRGVTLNLDAPDNLPIVTLDVHRIRQVVNNLLGNALKFTDKGAEVKVSLEHNTDERESILIRVTDTGPGIPAEQLPHIFKRLYQVREADWSTQGGLGLGLYICRQIMQMHNGEIDVDSQLGQGTTFTINLPILNKRFVEEGLLLHEQADS